MYTRLGLKLVRVLVACQCVALLGQEWGRPYGVAQAQAQSVASGDVCGGAPMSSSYLCKKKGECCDSGVCK